MPSSTTDTFLTNTAKTAYYNLLSQPNGFVSEARQVVMHNLFPNQFEYYFMAIELENSKGKTTDRMVFPILPKTIDERRTITSNVQKTAGGVISQFSTTFTPIDISISGTFGKEFKLLNNLPLNGEIDVLDNLAKGTWKEKWNSTKTFFNPLIFTGFGAFNELKRIFEKSRLLDSNGKPYKTIFYNLAFSSQYYVQLQQFNGNENVDQNFFHNFTLSMKAVGIARGKMINLITLSTASSLTKDVAHTMSKTVAAIKKVGDRIGEAVKYHQIR